LQGGGVVASVRVVEGIASELTEQAAQLLIEAFPLKIAHELRARTPEQARRLLAASMTSDLGWLALDEAGAVAGVLGVGVHGPRFFNWNFRILAREFGAFGAVPTWVFARLETIATRPVTGRWRIEVLAVGEATRGCGVGTKLFTTVVDAAREAGVQTVTLEVVDPNERALKLYQGLGFRCSFFLRTGRLTASSGYGGIRFMRLDL
jgi:ribosomal protein S18 acetylase RimI-like enzyme